MSAYVIIEKVPSLFPNTSPAKIAKNVCKDTGTVAPPIGTAKNGNQAVTLAPMAIKQTNTAPYVISIVRKRINEPPFVFLYHKREIAHCQPLFSRGDNQREKSSLH